MTEYLFPLLGTVFFVLFYFFHKKTSIKEFLKLYAAAVCFLYIALKLSYEFSLDLFNF